MFESMSLYPLDEVGSGWSASSLGLPVNATDETNLVASDGQNHAFVCSHT